MRRLALAFVILLLLSGCASPKKAAADPAADGASTPAPAGLGTNATLAATNATQPRMHFVGGDREANMTFQDTFAPTDSCFFVDSSLCPATGKRSHDITAVIPADVPVELTATLTTSGNVNVDFALADAQIIRLSEDRNGDITQLDATLVRSGAGTVALVVRFEFAAFDQPTGYASQVALDGLVHTITRSDLVPALLPVAAQLGPGDVVNATGDGLAQFVVFQPNGPALRDLTFPFGIRIPDSAAPGVYFLVADADEAVYLNGPNRTLTARLLDFTQTDPVDVQSNADTSWDMAVPGQPLIVGIQLRSKELTPGLGGPAAVGSHKLSLVSPDNVEVLGSSNTCLATCGLSLLGGLGFGYGSAFLDEHLVPGSYHATITMEASAGMHAYSWALCIRPA